MSSPEYLHLYTANAANSENNELPQGTIPESPPELSTPCTPQYTPPEPEDIRHTNAEEESYNRSR